MWWQRTRARARGAQHVRCPSVKDDAHLVHEDIELVHGAYGRVAELPKAKRERES